MDYEIGKVREVQTMDIEVVVDGAPEKVTFFFDPDKIKEAKVSFDGGKTELPVAMVQEVVMMFTQHHMEFSA
jgi:hypothetical protein